MADRKRVRLVVGPDGNASLPSLAVDPVKIFHAMDSLVASTIRFARPGSRIEIGVGSRAGKATIWLRTDGSGISGGSPAISVQPFPEEPYDPSGGPGRHRAGPGEGEANHRGAWRSDACPQRRGKGVDHQCHAAAPEACDGSQKSGRRREVGVTEPWRRRKFSIHRASRASPYAPGLMLSKSRNAWREISKEHRPGSALRVLDAPGA